MAIVTINRGAHYRAGCNVFAAGQSLSVEPAVASRGKLLGIFASALQFEANGPDVLPRQGFFPREYQVAGQGNAFIPAANVWARRDGSPHGGFDVLEPESTLTGASDANPARIQWADEEGTGVVFAVADGSIQKVELNVTMQKPGETFTGQRFKVTPSGYGTAYDAASGDYLRLLRLENASGSVSASVLESGATESGGSVEIDFGGNVTVSIVVGRGEVDVLSG